VYSERDIIEGCLKQERFFQELLYKTYASKMFGICLRYAPDKDIANDMFQESFIRVFQKLHQFKYESSLSSWMYRIFVTSSINYLQRKIKNPFEVSINDQVQYSENIEGELGSEDWMTHISTEEALKMVQELPEKYRVIINLYAVDKHNHSEIAELLHITETSSRSQLSRARKMLSEKLKIKLKQKIGE
jgi:RNA polymerase sigma factor (sigma-70 family)